jgi:hypothetical protein
LRAVLQARQEILARLRDGSKHRQVEIAQVGDVCPFPNVLPLFELK